MANKKGFRHYYSSRKKYEIDKNASREEIIKQYNRAVRTANKSLYRLEKMEDIEGFENVTKFAYAKAMKEIKSMRGDGYIRFGEVKEDVDLRKLRHGINAVTEFLNAPTRTKTGIIGVYESRADTINAKYGTDFTWQTMADYYSSGRAEKLGIKLGSSSALIKIGELQKKSTKELEDIYRSLNKNRKLKKYENKEELIYNTINHKNATEKKLDDLI